MEGGALFNPGFLGSSFMWWVGQIADDSTWRDNINSGNYEDKNGVPGWGRRYKVRIIGLHDQGEVEIPSDQLPWANVMYPITAGGFQTNSGQTPNLRQGNMVFGFFLDGQDQQVPVIMGVLGNNSQTALSQTIGDSSVTNAQAGSIAKSGYATGATGKGNAQEITPDQDKVVKQPARTGGGQQEAGPNASPQPGATLENESVHHITAGDVKRQEKCEEKIVLLKPDELIDSALKGIQTVIENLTKKLDKYLQALQSYVDAVSSVIDSIKNIINNAACEITKYMKIIFDKIMEYAMKVLNQGLTAVVAAMPSSLRYQFGDMKETFTELILCLYNKLMDGMCELIEGALTDAINPDQLEKDANDRANNGVDEDGNLNGAPTNPQVSICYAENLVSSVLVGKKSEIENANNNLINNMNAYLEDITEQLAGISGAIGGASDLIGNIGDITNLIPDISGGITSALSFANISLNIFGCELSPNIASSDFYTFCNAGDASPPAELPSSSSVSEGVNNSTAPTPVQPVPYAEPTRATEDAVNP